ncbi:LuxR C-terminal-related transcriptional regulator [Streptomyces rimosus]|uniref:LuxR C-terminal-related transcriptional regulator n=1 Tax=Streptomyces rimosus TaxID=1927 RepID=UPI00099DC86F|nr:LuxR C-terminal-related transcriptional regulator [Streptomyces rimosus]
MKFSALVDSPQISTGRSAAGPVATAVAPVRRDARPPADRQGVCMAVLDPILTIRQATQDFFRNFATPDETGADVLAGAPSDSSTTTAPDVCGRDFRELVHPSVRQPLMRQFERLLSGRCDRFSAHVVALRSEGDAFTGSLTATAVSGYAPDPAAVLVLMRPGQSTEGDAVVAPRKKLLSEIDARILEGIAAGLSTIPLASRLYLSRQGVEYHVTGLLRKLKVPNRAALVSRAYAMGVLTVGTWPPRVVEGFIK